MCVCVCVCANLCSKGHVLRTTCRPTYSKSDKTPGAQPPCLAAVPTKLADIGEDIWKGCLPDVPAISCRKSGPFFLFRKGSVLKMETTDKMSQNTS